MLILPGTGAEGNDAIDTEEYDTPIPESLEDTIEQLIIGIQDQVTYCVGSFTAYLDSIIGYSGTIFCRKGHRSRYFTAARSFFG